MRPLSAARRVPLAAPAALVGAVALIGLVVFSSGGPGRHQPRPRSRDTDPPRRPPGSVQQTPTAAPRCRRRRLPPRTLAHQPERHLSTPACPASFIAPGQALFAANCCELPRRPRPTGASRSRDAPNLQGLGPGTIDFWVSTGRMPLANPSAQATRKPPRFDRIQTLEIAAWVQSLTPGVGTQVPLVKTAGADLESGNTLFTLNCAACHTIPGAGDALMEGAYAPSLHLATPTQVVEAIRSGPGNMPHFSPGNITDTEARDIAAYVTGVLQHPNNPGGVGLGGIGPVGEGFVGLLIGVGVLMVVCFWIGDRT